MSEPGVPPPRSPSRQALVRAVLTRSVRLLEPEDTKGLFADALRAIKEVVPLDVCRIAMLRADAVCDVYTAGLDPGVEHRELPSEVGLVALALGSLDGTLVDREQLRAHADAELDAPLRSSRLCSALLLPLRSADGRVWGALICATAASGGYGPDHVGAIRMFAIQLGAALELLQARQDLRHWSAIVKSSHAPILGKDRAGRITHWNPAAERLFGYTAAEAIGREIAIIVPPGRRQELAGIMERTARGESVEELETVRMTKSGRQVPVIVTVSPIHDSAGEVIGSSSIVRDITAHKLANERFRLAVESSPNAMLLADHRGRIVMANLEAELLFGYTRAELYGNPIEMLLPRELSAAHQAHREGFMHEPRKREMGGGRELWALRKDGTQLAVEVALNPIAGDGDASVLASVVDISERRRVERERARLLRETQQAVEARDTFLSVASHELKTPLTALQLTVQGLARAASRPRQLTPEQLVNKLAATTRQVTRLATLVDQLLDVSRLTAGRFRLECGRTDVSAVIADVVERFIQSAEACEIRTFGPGPVWGEWDAGRLDQVVTNLVANAVKYGEGKPIDVHVSEQGTSALIAVQDHGPGIAPEDQARIFDRFERLVSHRHFGGFGLGLWIVRQLVEAHGGSIEVHSAPQSGSKFVVTLPKASPSS